MSIKIQKILLFIPVVNFICVFFWLRQISKSGCGTLRFLKDFLKIAAGIAAVWVVWNVFNRFILPREYAPVNAVFLYLILFVCSFLAIRSQEKLMQNNTSGGAGQQTDDCPAVREPVEPVPDSEGRTGDIGFQKYIRWIPVLNLVCLILFVRLYAQERRSIAVPLIKIMAGEFVLALAGAAIMIALQEKPWAPVVSVVFLCLCTIYMAWCSVAAQKQVLLQNRKSQ